MLKQTTQKLTYELKRYLERFIFSPATGRAEFWKTISVVARCFDQENANATNTRPRTLPGIVVCTICKSVLNYDCEKAGSSHIKRHAEHCKPEPHGSKKQQLPTSHFNNKSIKLNDSERLEIKNAELEFCVRGSHSFNSLENDGLITLLQQLVNIAGKHGCFYVKDVLYGRQTISSFCKEKAAEIKESLRCVLTEPQEAESLAVTLDLWTDDYKYMSYINVHAFWIDQSFEMKYHISAISHFGTERHTAGNIEQTVQKILSEYEIDASNVTATTDHGANVVSAFCMGLLNSSARLDCRAHRLHICFTTMWSRACSAQPKFLEYDNHASDLAKYCNQEAGVQEHLPVPIKKGSTTRRWEGLIDRAHFINESYDMLTRILSDPHRDRAMLVTSVSRRLNAEILMFMRRFGKLFQVLQFNSKPTINFAVLTYYKAFELAQPCRSDRSVIATLKKEFQQRMDKSFFESSLKAHHWLATFLDPLYEHFEFLPTTTREEVQGVHKVFRQFKKFIDITTDVGNV